MTKMTFHNFLQKCSQGDRPLVSPKNYWKVLKFRLVKEGNESVTNCNQLKLVSPKDGKRKKGLISL